jgi:hypothetical protein
MIRFKRNGDNIDDRAFGAPPEQDTSDFKTAVSEGTIAFPSLQADFFQDTVGPYDVRGIG